MEKGADTWYFTAAANKASIRLHEGFGFKEERRGIELPDVSFVGGVGILFRLRFESARQRKDSPSRCQSFKSYWLPTSRDVPCVGRRLVSIRQVGYGGDTWVPGWEKP